MQVQPSIATLKPEPQHGIISTRFLGEQHYGMRRHKAFRRYFQRLLELGLQATCMYKVIILCCGSDISVVSSIGELKYISYYMQVCCFLKIKYECGQLVETSTDAR